MKNFLERLKDFIYDYIDFVMIILVVVLIGAIIFWRLDILFDDTKVDDNDNDIKIEEPKKEDKPNDDKEKEEKDNDENKKEDSTGEDTTDSNENIEINIAEGSSSEAIAQILLDKKLIKDKGEFLLRLSDLDLETKLRPGIFELNKGTDIDTIIKTLANQI